MRNEDLFKLVGLKEFSTPSELNSALSEMIKDYSIPIITGKEHVLKDDVTGWHVDYLVPCEEKEKEKLDLFLVLTKCFEENYSKVKLNKTPLFEAKIEYFRKDSLRDSQIGNFMKVSIFMNDHRSQMNVNCNLYGLVDWPCYTINFSKDK